MTTVGIAGRLFGRQPGRFARAFRVLTGTVYLLGAPTHVYFAVANPDGYRDFSEWAPPITELSRAFWESWFLPNARVLALCIAAVELTIAALIFGRGIATRLGLLGALKFHVALAVLFGIWIYTIPMIVLLAPMLRYDFTSGPLATAIHHVRAPIRTTRRLAVTSMRSGG